MTDLLARLAAAVRDRYLIERELGRGGMAIVYLAHDQKLGQLYAQMGDTAKSLEHCTTFLHAFTDPDPEYVWMVERARAEVERLGRGR